MTMAIKLDPEEAERSRSILGKVVNNDWIMLLFSNVSLEIC